LNQKPLKRDTTDYHASSGRSRGYFWLAIPPSIRLFNTPSGSAPASSTWSWKARGSNLSSSGFRGQQGSKTGKMSLIGGKIAANRAIFQYFSPAITGLFMKESRRII
jgi:hypothetical protein